MMFDEYVEGKTWRCTKFYKALDESQREASCCPHILWLVIGDFNEITYVLEKKRGLPQRETQMSKF